MERQLSITVRLDAPYDEAIRRTTEALKAEGFGVLTRVDVRATLKEKLGVEFRPYAILGVCNPPLAHRALSHRAEAGLLLPCNVTVEAIAEGGSLVRIGDPHSFLAIGGLDRDPELREVAQEARRRLERVAAALGGKA
jgi:uncharacterized protein (DUF302 family)